MIQSQRLVRAKLSLLELGELLNNVSKACRVMGVSRQHFYDIKQAYQEGRVETLKEHSHGMPNLKNLVAQEINPRIAFL